MFRIKVSVLHLAGLELFQDSENFLNQLTDEEIAGVVGGLLYLDIFYSLSDIPLPANTDINTQVRTVYSETLRTIGVSYTAKTVN
jgi:hypothetical protein